MVAKPSSDTPLSGVLVAEIFQQAGLPPGHLQPAHRQRAGGGRRAWSTHPDVDGLTFTGSYDVGLQRPLPEVLAHAIPKPCIVEMGGKNPAIVMDSADLDRAASGVFRSAFGMNGHKCSACSRVYVHEAVADELRRAADQADRGDADRRSAGRGRPSSARWPRKGELRGLPALRRAGPRAAAKIRTGGAVLTEGALRPRLLRRAHHRDRPAARPRADARGAVRAHPGGRDASQTWTRRWRWPTTRRFGLTAGFFSSKQDEIDSFLDRIEAGVVYVNRAAGATTGAWPGVQPFGGWKGSGSTGKNIGGLYTLPCYLREQSRTVVA